MNFFTAQNIFDIFIVLGGVAFIFAQVSLGKQNKKSGEETDALTTIKIKDAAILALQEETARLNRIVTQDGKDIAVLKADKDRLEALVANRNPELETFIITATKILQQLLENQKIGMDGIHTLLAKPVGTTVINQPNAN